MPGEPKRAVTELLSALGNGDQAAAGQLLPLVYHELRKLAKARMAAEPAQTLQPTALVHEAYLRLVGEAGGGDTQWKGRGHFFGAAALAMRRIMVERARVRGQLKRGGDRKRVSLDENAVATESGGENLLALDRALERLEAVEPRQAQVVMLRYFVGLTIEQTAAALDLSVGMVRKEWTVARAWLYREIARENGDGG
jgi:RNA polymerase sigma factor (TIGR02999 family)